MQNTTWWSAEQDLEIVGDTVFWGEYNLKTIAQQFGTPLYVYHLEKIKKNYQKVVQTLSRHAAKRLDIRVYYAMKANGAIEVLETLQAEGAWVDTSSIGEVQRVLQLGYDPKKVIFTGTNFGLSEFEFLARSGVLINVDSFSQLKRLAAFSPMDISIRLNPSVGGIGFNEKFDMSGNNAKATRLGIYIDRIIEAFHTARTYGLNPIALHQHVGSNWLQKNSFDAYMQAVGSAIDVVKVLEQSGFRLKVLNLGGGLGVRSHEQYAYFPLEQFAQAITQAVVESGIHVETLAIEPGRYIVGDAGVLLATTNLVEQKHQTRYIGLDVGFNAFHHKFIYGIDNTIVNISKLNSSIFERYAVVGYLGEQGDVFSESEVLPVTEEGDIFMLYPAGAYCASELANHHLLPVPKEFFIEAKKEDLSLLNFCKVCPKNCCYGSVVNLTTTEYLAIKERVEDDTIFTMTEDGIMQMNNYEDVCPLLAADGFTCTIQDIKPIECKAYPVLVNTDYSMEKVTLGVKCPAAHFIHQHFIEVAHAEFSKFSDDMIQSIAKQNKDYGFF